MHESDETELVMTRYQDFNFDTISIRYWQNIAINQSINQSINKNHLQ